MRRDDADAAAALGARPVSAQRVSPRQRPVLARACAVFSGTFAGSGRSRRRRLVDRGLDRRCRLRGLGREADADVLDLDALADVERLGGRRRAAPATVRGGGSENVRSSARTRMLLAGSGLLACRDRSSRLGSAVLQRPALRASRPALPASRREAPAWRLRLRSRRDLARRRAFGASLSAGCFAVSDVFLLPCSSQRFAFTTPVATVFGDCRIRGRRRATAVPR